MDEVKFKVVFQEERELEEQAGTNQHNDRDRIHNDICYEPSKPERKILDPE